ncbi:hypothetical protein ACFWU3_22060 [Streptomyces sp. NPDC058685]
MYESADWSTLSYKGLDGVPLWVILIVVVIAFAWMAVSWRRRNKP